MMCSRQIAFSMVTLCGIAVIAILRRSYLRNAADKNDMIIITRMPRKQAANKKDIISQQAANKKDIISQQAANKKDIISQLPNDILLSIITRMDTKFAVRTSILSKRWRNLYKFVPDINFYCHSYPYSHEAAIIDSVERFLRLRSRSKIHSFHFRCRLTKSYADRFEKCIYSLGRLGVEKIVVYFSCCKNFHSCRKYSCCRSADDISFSCHLLSKMPSLKYFQLALCSLQPNLKSQCNSLQTLSLMNVTVLPGALECILSNCLRLHSLIIDSCDCPSKLCFRGPKLRLKSLIIQDCEDVKEIELYASDLIKFEFQNPEMVKFIFDHVPQLQSIRLDSYNKNIMSYVFGELAKDLSHLESLACCIQDDFDQESTRLMGMGIKMFNNLRQLELKIYCTPKTNLLALILESCPLLREFHLDILYNIEHDGGVAQPGKQVVLHSELKKVKISGFNRTGDEVAFASYILKSAVSLEQMHILISRICKYYYSMRDKARWHKMIEKQLQEQALSKTAQVIIKYAF